MLQTLDWQLGLIAIAALVGLLGLLKAYLSIRTLQNHILHLKQQQAHYEQALKALQDSVIAMGRHITDLESDQPVEATERFASQSPSLPHTTISSDQQDAIALLKAGLDTGEVARRCGISRAEASLMKMMNQVNAA